MIKLESYDLDTLRELIRALQAENRSLREFLAENKSQMLGCLCWTVVVSPSI